MIQFVFKLRIRRVLVFVLVVNHDSLSVPFGYYSHIRAHVEEVSQEHTCDSTIVMSSIAFHEWLIIVSPK